VTSVGPAAQFDPHQVIEPPVNGFAHTGAIVVGPTFQLI
jgi:hypothetical protein